jgi:hypothetical protein
MKRAESKAGVRVAPSLLLCRNTRTRSQARPQLMQSYMCDSGRDKGLDKPLCKTEQYTTASSLAVVTRR